MKRWVVVAFGLIFLAASNQDAFAWKKKVAQSGMTYLAVSLGARESAMGDASVATTEGIHSIFFNPAALAGISSFGVAVNQVNWLVDTRLYGAAFGYSLGRWGAVAADVVYMDYGEIMGTQVVPHSVDIRGYQLTGKLNIQDYAFGLTYAYRVSDHYAFGVRIKRVHEDLGKARYAVREYTDPETGELVRERKVKDWQLSAWGMDFGSLYNTGFRSLVFAMSMQNLSSDMRYWYEEFSLPLVFRMGIAADVLDFVGESDHEAFDWNVAIDALHPTDYTERLHVGTELVILKRYAFRAGYKFNHDVETYSFGVGFKLNVAGVEAQLDYAYTAANYFKDVNRFSLQFMF